MPDGQSYNIDFSGVNQNTGLSYDDLKVLKRSQIRIRWAIGKDLVFSDIGEGYINELSVEDATNTDSLFSGSIRGYGRPTTIAQGIGVNTEEFLSDGTDDNLITP